MLAHQADALLGRRGGALGVDGGEDDVGRHGHRHVRQGLERGEIDGVSWIWPEEMAAAAQRKDLQILSAPMSGYTLIYLNLQNPM